MHIKLCPAQGAAVVSAGINDPFIIGGASQLDRRRSGHHVASTIEKIECFRTVNEWMGHNRAPKW